LRATSRQATLGTMPGWIRRRRWLAVATVVSLSVAAGTNVATHGMGGHDDHGPLLVVHDASAHAFTGGSATPDGESLHCVLCHLTRVARPPAEGVQHAPAHDNRAQMARRLAPPVPAVFPAAEPPLRSPPLSV
jgi:hypothetical protein